jgi:Spy/CpxP family protein refolding chaperone
MIFKRVTVFAIAAAFGAVMAGPLLAQRSSTARDQAQSGRGKTSASAPQTPAPRPAPWWRDEKSQKELGLTAAQSKAIEDIYNSSKDELAGYRDSIDRERKVLDQMIVESKAEQWVILKQIGRMETSRSDFNKTYYMMLYRMNRQLTADQRTKLQAMAARGREGRGGGGGLTLRDPKPGR